MTTLIKNFEHLLSATKSDILKNEKGFYISFGESDINQQTIFDKLLIHDIRRKIKGKDISFYAIRIINLKEEYRGHGMLSKFLNELETLDMRIMFQDVVNDSLKSFLMKRNYSIHNEKKYDHEMVSLYRL